jgi:integrase
MSGHVSDRWHLKRQPKRAEAVCEHRKIPTAKHGNGRRWQVEYTDPDCKLHYPCLDTEKAADDFLVKVKADVLRGTYRHPGGGQVTVRKHAQEVWLPAQGFDASTRERVQTALRRQILPPAREGGLGDKRLHELATYPSIVQTRASGLRLAPSGASYVLVTQNAIMRSAMRDKLIYDNPCTGIKVARAVKRRIDPWTPETIALVRAGLSADRYQAVIDAGCGLGLREGELFAMSAENTDWLRRVVHIRVQLKMIAGRLYFSAPKGRKERTVPLAAQTSMALAAHLEQFPARAITLPWHKPGSRRHGKPHTLNLLFTRPDGRAVDRTVFNRLCGALGARPPDDERVHGCHMMRHVYASTLIAKGIDVRTVAEYLGHSDGGALVLRTYSHLLPDAEDRARKALEEALSGTLPVAQDTGSM